MGFLGDILNFVRGAIQSPVETATQAVQGAGQRVQEFASSLLRPKPTPVKPQEAPKKASPQEPSRNAEEADVEAYFERIASLEDLARNNVISQDDMQRGLVNIGMQAYQKMLQYQAIIRLVEEKTGESIIRERTKAMAQQMEGDMAYEAEVRFHASWHCPPREGYPQGYDDEEYGPKFYVRGNKDTIPQQIAERLPVYAEEVKRRICSGAEDLIIEPEILNMRRYGETLYQYEETSVNLEQAAGSYYGAEYEPM
jgi:hypothetical protein